MKKLCLTAIIFVPLFIVSDGLKAQASLTKLDQVELIKQFVSNWKGETGKDTTVFWEIRSNGTGLECNFKFLTNNKVFWEGKQHWEYDKKADKFLLSSMTGGMDTWTSILWFTAKNKCIIIAYSDIANPDKASFKIETEFRSPDVFIQKTILNNAVITTVPYNRVKP
jgi:hypothetical protein